MGKGAPPPVVARKKVPVAAFAEKDLPRRGSSLLVTVSVAWEQSLYLVDKPVYTKAEYEEEVASWLSGVHLPGNGAFSCGLCVSSRWCGTFDRCGAPFARNYE